ncbi:Ig-like domain-containing protein [Streptomyces sp. 6N223]|uniref:Ig-like domain-containing protein n=1 Tax=Streptomyces sp. 6N223 TaxID=3457412 RepID=UPI003FD31BA4
MPTGTVTFAISGGPTLTGTLDASGTATTTTDAIPVGTQTVTATYSGDTNFTGSSGTASQTVAQASSATTVTVSPPSSVFGEPVTLTASVVAAAPGEGVPTGTVTFTISGGPTLTGTLDASGTATVSTDAILVGTQTVTASYSGDAEFTGSSGTTTLAVAQASTETSVTVSPDPSAAGQPVLLTASVSAVPPGAGVPTGTVTFAVSGGPTLTAPLNAAEQASGSTSALTSGTHTVTATYSGDGCFSGSSGTITQDVRGANTSLTASSATIRLRANGTFFIPTLTATLTNRTTRSPIPGQTITFTVETLLGQITLGTAVTDSSGRATLTNATVPPLAILANSYKAMFAGAPGLSASTATGRLSAQLFPPVF